MVLDWRRGELAEGLGCYDRGEFFAAHEHWELVWLRLEEPEKSFLQAVIQVTAAFHHWQAGNPAGTVSLLRRALRRLEVCPRDSGGISVAPLHQEILEWLREMQSGVLVERAFPRICPVESIGESVPEE